MKRITAVLFVALSAVMWGFIGFFIRNVSGLGGSEITLFRFAMGFVFIYSYVILTRKKIGRLFSKWFVINGIVYSVWVALYFNSIVLGTPLANAAFLLYMATIFTIIFSRIMLKESARKSVVIVILFALIGVFMILKPANLLSHYGELLALGAGILYGLQTVIVRKLKKKSDTYSIVLSSFLIALFVMVPLNVNGFVVPNFKSSINIVLLGIISTTIPFILFTESLKKLKAFEASAIALIEPITASLVGFFVFVEYLDALSIIGIIMILLANVYISRNLGK